MSARERTRRTEIFMFFFKKKKGVANFLCMKKKKGITSIRRVNMRFLFSKITTCSSTCSGTANTPAGVSFPQIIKLNEAFGLKNKILHYFRRRLSDVCCVSKNSQWLRPEIYSGRCLDPGSGESRRRPSAAILW